MPYANHLSDAEPAHYAGTVKAARVMKLDLRAIWAARLFQTLAGPFCARCPTACTSGPDLTVGRLGPEASKKDPVERALDAKSPIKVALLLPLSGSPQTAAIAKGMKQAAELALFELN